MYEDRFYNPKKKYFKKYPVLNVNEKRFYNYMRKKLYPNYIITPQVNLQTIIETDSNNRNNELFRNIDFGIFDIEMYNPIMLIEINGKQHDNNMYWIKRDKSVKEILDQANIMLFTINNKDLTSDIKIEKLSNELIDIIIKIENIIYY